MKLCGIHEGAAQRGTPSLRSKPGKDAAAAVGGRSNVADGGSAAAT